MCLHPEFSGTHVQDMFSSLAIGVQDGKLWRGPAAKVMLDTFNFDAGNSGHKVQKHLENFYHDLENAYSKLESGEVRNLHAAGFRESRYGLPFYFDPSVLPGTKMRGWTQHDLAFTVRNKSEQASKFREAILAHFGVRSLTEDVPVNDPMVMRSRAQQEIESTRLQIESLRDVEQTIEDNLSEARGKRSSLEEKLSDLEASFTENYS